MRKQIIMVFITILISICTRQIAASAIPMWEFLSRDEKMSYLYRLFSTQVATYCQDSTMPDCNKNLLLSGLQQLVQMDENDLNDIDPYQRGANDMIWRALIGRNQLDSRLGQGSMDSYSSEVDPLATSESDHNDLGEESAPKSDYVKPADVGGPYLMGPMVIRVLPDGRPVPGDDLRPLPQDEDLDDIKYSKVSPFLSTQTKQERIYVKKPYSTAKRAPINQKIRFINSRNYRRNSPYFFDLVQ